MDVPSAEKAVAVSGAHFETLTQLPLELQCDNRIWKASVQGRGES